MRDETAYLLDFSAHGRIRATGEDRARLIHALSTNHIQELHPGEGAYAFFLTAQGRILADAHILCYPDSLLIDVEAETRGPIVVHIGHYIIAEDVTLEDITDETFSFGVEGASAAAFLTRLNVPLPEGKESHLAWENLTVAAISATGAGGYRIYGPALRNDEIWQRLLIAGAKRSSLHALRMEHFQPRYGEDITQKTLPQEAALPQALHFQKGCYLGQEVVERVRSRGLVTRMLSGLVFEAEGAPEPGTKVIADNAKAGEITSSHGHHAIAMLRMQNIKPGTELTAAGRRAVTWPIANG